MPPTGPAALNGLRNHSRASSTTSLRPQPPPGPHASKASMSGPQQPYGSSYPAQSPRIPVNNGRNSPFPDYHDDVCP